MRGMNDVDRRFYAKTVKLLGPQMPTAASVEKVREIMNYVVGDPKSEVDDRILVSEAAGKVLNGAESIQHGMELLEEFLSRGGEEKEEEDGDG